MEKSRAIFWFLSNLIGNLSFINSIKVSPRWDRKGLGVVRETRRSLSGMMKAMWRAPIRECSEHSLGPFGLRRRGTKARFQLKLTLGGRKSGHHRGRTR